MEISTSLVDLLRLYDCVIIPDLGGFIANYRAAEMDLAGNRFLPPKKEIVFSSKLNKNDGLLVNYICETEGVGYLEARKMISEFTEEAWSKLENGETLEFPRIGSLTFDKNEKLIFEPAVAENLLLDAYGMESFHFPELKRQETVVAKNVFRDKDAVRPVFASRKMKRVLIAIPILIALALIPVSKMAFKEGLFNHQLSSTASLPLADTPKMVIEQPKQDLTTPEVVAKEENHTEDSKESALVAAQPKPEPVASAATTGARYHIVGGCFRSRENAERMVGILTGKGYNPEMDTMRNGDYRVSVQSFNDKKEALAMLSRLRKAEPNAGYWMMAE